MKTAISIPDNIFSLAEQAAKSMGISRSELYTRAIKEYVDSKKDNTVTEKLNKLYKESMTGLDETLSKIQFSSIPKEDW